MEREREREREIKPFTLSFSGSTMLSNACDWHMEQNSLQKFCHFFNKKNWVNYLILILIFFKLKLLFKKTGPTNGHHLIHYLLICIGVVEDNFKQMVMIQPKNPLSRKIF